MAQTQTHKERLTIEILDLAEWFVIDESDMVTVARGRFDEDGSAILDHTYFSGMAYEKAFKALAVWARDNAEEE